LRDFKENLEKANQQIAENREDYQALQADLELACTINNHEIEMAVEKRLTEFKIELLNQSQKRIRKNMEGEPIDTNSMEEEVDW
jgi:hypothetical protein